MFDKDLDGVCEYEYLLPIENDDINSILEKLFMNSPFENYFNNDLSEPKSNILKFNNQKFVIEVAESNNVQILILTNYSDGRIIYRFTK